MDKRPNRLYGRRKGKSLRPHQAQLIKKLLPKLAVNPSDPIDPKELFPDAQAIYMEIGFGGGEHLAHEAAQNPDIGFIGVEPFENGMAKMLAQIEVQDLANVRLFQGDAIEVLRALPDNALARVDLLYPDPWPKKRHWKRRFVSDDSLDELARVLRSGGLFRFASDIDTYVDWTLSHCRAHNAFAWTAERANDWLTPWEGWPSTRYEAKAVREGRPPHYLVFNRL